MQKVGAGWTADTRTRQTGDSRCAAFNAHSSVWGLTHTHTHRWETVGELMDEMNLACLNDGRGTRVNITAGAESALDMTLEREEAQ